MKRVVFCIVLLIFLASCRTETPTGGAVFNIDVTEPSGSNSVLSMLEVHGAAMNRTVNDYASALEAWDAKRMHALLASNIRSRMSAENLERMLSHFQPKEGTTVVLVGLNATPRGIEAVLRRGSDTFGYERVDLPLVLEDDEWKVVHLDDLTSRNGLLAACEKKTEDDFGSGDYRTAILLASSACVSTAAYVLDDPTLCPLAPYDVDSCFGRLGKNLTRNDWKDICNSIPQDRYAGESKIAKCLFEAAVKLTDLTLCTNISKAQIERYFCLGKVGAALEDPWQCLDGFSDYVIRQCLETYIDEVNTRRTVCEHEELAKYVPC